MDKSMPFARVDVVPPSAQKARRVTVTARLYDESGERGTLPTPMCLALDKEPTALPWLLSRDRASSLSLEAPGSPHGSLLC